MKKNYYENPAYNVAFERCVDVLAELIEKYAGRVSMCDIGYDYCVYIGNTPVTIVVGNFDNTRDWFKDYYERSYRNMNSVNKVCQKAS